MQRKKSILLSIMLVGVTGFLFFAKTAQAAGLIPCGGEKDPCTLCHLIVGFHGIVKYGMSLIIIVAITAITIAGVMYVISAGDEEMMKKAKGFIKASLMGFAFVFLGWLIVSITMFLFSARPNLGVIPDGSAWNKFKCSTVSSSGQTSGALTIVAAENCCVVSAGKCSHVKDATKCTTGTYKTGSCGKLGECAAQACGKNESGYCYDGNAINPCPTGITQALGGVDCPTGLYCCSI